MNKKSLIATALIATLAAGPAMADRWHPRDRWDHDDYRGRVERDHVERARVVRVEPIREVERVPTSYRDCYDQQRRHYARGPGNGAGTVMGAVVGGVVGNHIGDRHSRPATTVLGAVVGGLLGNELGRGRGQSYTTVERNCDYTRAYTEQTRTIGYRVTYRYQGQLYTQQMDHDPGDWVRVHVDVTPLD